MKHYFLDTNVLLYAIGDDADERKHVARQLLAGTATISVQVLTEFANVMHNKRKHEFLEIGEITDKLMQRLEVIELTALTHQLALQVAARYKVNLFDAQIAASAMLADCPVLYTEGMHHGLSMSITYKKREFMLSVRNPFL